MFRFRGCGFVQFPDERLQKRALEECQGAVGLGGKPLRLSLAANKWVLLNIFTPLVRRLIYLCLEHKANDWWSSDVHVSPSLVSLRNRPPQQQQSDRSWQSNSGYTHSYDQYNQYNQYQQQAYPGYYSPWGYDQTGAGYGYQQYDYTQYPPPQVSALCINTYTSAVRCW